MTLIIIQQEGKHDRSLSHFPDLLLNHDEINTSLVLNEEKQNKLLSSFLSDCKCLLGYNS